jgi:hypothetical protein
LTRSTESGVPETALSMLRSLPQNKREAEESSGLDSISDAAEAFWGSSSPKSATAFGGKPPGGTPPSGGFAPRGSSSPLGTEKNAEVGSSGMAAKSDAGAPAPITVPPASPAPGDNAASPFAIEGGRVNGAVDDFAANAGAPAPEDNSANSDKAFSDAKELHALSELLSMSGEGAGAKPTADTPLTPGVAKEASQGMVLDLKPLDSAAPSEAEKAPRESKTPIRTLLDRLRGLGSEPPEAGPAADTA